MRAVVHDRYGPPEVLRIEDVERPVPEGRRGTRSYSRDDCQSDGLPRACGQALLLAIHARLRRPRNRILGSELAGVVVEVGSQVTEVAVGDEVFGVRAYLSEGFGCHAEYVCVREKLIAHKPAGASFEHAAAICDGGLAGLGSVRTGGVRNGRSVLVYGASGSIGTATTQLAAHFGARVTAVCNTKNLELVRSLGAEEVLDYDAGGLHEERRHLRRRRRRGRQALVHPVVAAR